MTLPYAAARTPSLFQAGRLTHAMRATHHWLVRGFLESARRIVSRAEDHSLAAQQVSAAATTPREDEPMEHMLATDDTRIAYQRAGSGPPLVLIHGAASDRTMWAGVMPTLGQCFTVHAVDQSRVRRQRRWWRPSRHSARGCGRRGDRRLYQRAGLCPGALLRRNLRVGGGPAHRQSA